MIVLFCRLIGLALLLHGATAQGESPTPSPTTTPVANPRPCEYVDLPENFSIFNAFMATTGENGAGLANDVFYGNPNDLVLPTVHLENTATRHSEIWYELPRSAGPPCAPDDQTCMSNSGSPGKLAAEISTIFDCNLTTKSWEKRISSIKLQLKKDSSDTEFPPS